MTDALSLYNRLIADVDRFLAGVYTRLAGGMVCGPGCDSCCRQILSLLPVEASWLRRGFDALPEEDRLRVSDTCKDIAVGAGGEACPLLQDGKCILYEYRPLVCRTHGFPLYSDQFREVKGAPVDFCHLNFTGESDISTISRNEILNLDLLDQKLFVVNRSFMEEMGRGIENSGERISMAQLFLEREVIDNDEQFIK